MYMTMVEATDSSERGMYPVTITIISPRKEHWTSQGSSQPPPVFNMFFFFLSLTPSKTSHGFYLSAVEDL